MPAPRQAEVLRMAIDLALKPGASVAPRSRRIVGSASPACVAVWAQDDVDAGCNEGLESREREEHGLGGEAV